MYEWNCRCAFVIRRWRKAPSLGDSIFKIPFRLPYRHVTIHGISVYIVPCRAVRVENARCSAEKRGAIKRPDISPGSSAFPNYTRASLLLRSLSVHRELYPVNYTSRDINWIPSCNEETIDIFLRAAHRAILNYNAMTVELRYKIDDLETPKGDVTCYECAIRDSSCPPIIRHHRASYMLTSCIRELWNSAGTFIAFAYIRGSCADHLD